MRYRVAILTAPKEGAPNFNDAMRRAFTLSGQGLLTLERAHHDNHFETFDAAAKFAAVINAHDPDAQTRLLVWGVYTNEAIGTTPDGSTAWGPARLA
jgi:hypothetical protein